MAYQRHLFILFALRASNAHDYVNVNVEGRLER